MACSPAPMFLAFKPPLAVTSLLTVRVDCLNSGYAVRAAVHCSRFHRRDHGNIVAVWVTSCLETCGQHVTLRIDKRITNSLAIVGIICAGSCRSSFSEHATSPRPKSAHSLLRDGTGDAWEARRRGKQLGTCSLRASSSWPGGISPPGGLSLAFEIVFRAL